MKKRLVSMLLVLAMTVGMVPVTAFAAENNEAQEETIEEPAISLEEESDVPVEEEIAPSEEEEEPAVEETVQEPAVEETVQEPAEEEQAAEVGEPEEVEVPEEALLTDEAALLGAEEEPVVNEETGRVQGPEGDEDVAVVVYGKTMAEALLGITGDFSTFAQALKAELQGILANEKLPDVELYLVNDNNEEYRLTKDAVDDAAMISSFEIKGSDMGKIIEWLGDICQWIYEKIFSGVGTIGQFYKIYGAENVPEGDYTLEIRKIKGEGYTLYRPSETTMKVHVGDSNVNYVGDRVNLGKIDLSIDIYITDIDLGDVTVYAPGVYLNTADPGFAFTSADLGGNALPGTEYVLVNRDETVKIIKAAYKLGKDTFTNAMNLVGTDGYTWKDLSILYNQVITLDEESLQLALNEEQAYKLLVTYWSLIKASAMDPAITFMSNDTNIRVPAILKAKADSSGRVFFGEKNNVTLTWSLEILLRMSNVIVQDIGSTDIDALNLDDETAAIVRLVLSLAKYGLEKGVDFFDEDGQVAADFINDWIYPILQNDSVMEMAKEALTWFIGEDELTAEDKKMLELLPSHAILTKKMPAGKYIMFESSVPRGYLLTPLFYTIDMSWNTDSSLPREWCYVSFANLGVLTPYFAEEYYNYLRSYNASAEADRILNKITGNETGTLIQDIISDKTDVSALMIAYYSGIIYNYMGGKYVYGSELEVSTELTKYLYVHGRTAQNLLIFGNEVAKKSKSVVTDRLTRDWKFYTYTTSIRTNLALRTQAILKGIADHIDTTGDNVISSAVKDAVNSAADNIDTSNRIVEETEAAKEQVKEGLSNIMSGIASKVRDAAKDTIKTLLGWSQKYGR